MTFAHALRGRYTSIPKSFEVEINSQKMWVHGNATEHMYEDVYAKIMTGGGTAYTNSLG